MRKLLLVQVILLLGSFSVFSQASAEAYVKNMHELQRQGKYAEAIDEINKAIAIQPENAQYLVDRARLNALVKDYQALDADIEKAVTLAPNDLRVVASAAGVMTMARQCEKALSIVDSSISRGPQNEMLYTTRSAINTCLKNLPAALSDIEMAIDLNPGRSHHRATQARLLSEMGNSENAMEIFRSVIDSLEARLAAEQNPRMKSIRGSELAMIYSTRAQVFDRGHKSEQAIADYSRAIELSPNQMYFRSRAFSYQNAKMYQAAIADYDRIIADDTPKGSFEYLQRGDLHMMTGSYEKAISDFEAALKFETPMRKMIESKIAVARQKLGQAQQ